MKRIFWIVTLMLILSADIPAFAGFASELEKGDLPKVVPPPVDVIILKNGIRCFLLEDHTLPMVRIQLIARAGSVYDPSDKAGLAELTTMLMRIGGAGNLSPDDFDSESDRLGAQIGTFSEHEMAGASLKVLSSDMEKGAALLFDIVFAPGFDKGRFKTARLKIEERLRREDDEPSSLAGRMFRQYVYGEKSPWARRPDAKSLSAITSDDIRKFHQKYFRADNILIAASGDFNRNELILLFERMTANAPTGNVDFPVVPPVTLEFKPGTKQVKRSVTQSFIRMGHLGIKRHNPDKFALMLLDDILGASNFKSRLMEDIRTKRGMAYRIWSDISLQTDYGLFTVGVNTTAAQASEVIKLIREEIRKLAENGEASDDELEFARQSILSRLVFEYDSAFKAVYERASFYFYGYPDDYWKIFRRKIAGVNKEDIRSVAHKYLHPDGLKVVIVGP